MRLKTSVTLSSELLAEIDKAAANRSAFLETAAKRYLADLQRKKMDERDIAAINAQADDLNREALDVLDYQALS